MYYIVVEIEPEGEMPAVHIVQGPVDDLEWARNCKAIYEEVNINKVRIVEGEYDLFKNFESIVA